MNPDEIYAKTEEGLRELKERKRNLPIALRSLLIMVDGNRTVAEVLERARALRVDDTALTTLERAGLIAKIAGVAMIVLGVLLASNLYINLSSFLARFAPKA